jgi:L-ascorbate metabolism protein UlaG (beta-lactamase superfamily)
MDGTNILTDPVWSYRIGPFSGLGPARHIPPGIRIEDLPPIDIILLSHNHYDHLDIPTLKILAKRNSAQIYNALGNSALLTKNKIGSSREMDWWEEVNLENGLSITFVPSRHFSSRSMFDRNKTLWGGFVIKGPSGTVYFASDTGMGPHFEEIKKRFGRPRLAILPIGSYLPRWFMAPMHLSPEEALEVHNLLGAGTSLAVHYGTFELGDDGQFEAVEKIQEIMKKEPGLEKKFWILMPGEGRDVP